MLTGRLLAYVALRGQQALQNLDTTEQYRLGGPEGVRAFAPGEGTGDTGTLLSLELRFLPPEDWFGRIAREVVAALFFDAGRVRCRTDPRPDPITGNNLPNTSPTSVAPASGCPGCGRTSTRCASASRSRSRARRAATRRSRTRGCICWPASCSTRRAFRGVPRRARDFHAVHESPPAPPGPPLRAATGQPRLLLLGAAAPVAFGLLRGRGADRSARRPVKQTAPNQLSIQQGTQKAGIDWTSFSIGAGERRQRRPASAATRCS